MTPSTLWVTGGAGFLGRAVVGKLLDTGASVRCLVRSQPAADALRRRIPREARQRLDIVSGSLDSLVRCRELVRGCDAGVHVAAAGTGCTASLFLNNVVSTRTLLAALREQPLHRVVLVSSLAVHRTDHLRAGDTLDETCPADPQPHLRDPYTFSKVAQERICRDAVNEWNLPLVVVRPGVIYGPGRDCITSRVGLRVGPFLVQMGGRHKLPYTYVENCADAIVRAVSLPGIDGQSFNVVDDELPTGNEIVSNVRARGVRVRVVKIPTPAIQPLSRLYHWYSRRSRGQVPPVLTAYRSSASWKPLRYSNAKARTTLGWTPAVHLRAALETALTSGTHGAA